LAGRAHALHALEPVEDFYALSQERRLPSWRRPADVTRIAEDQLRNDMMAVPANVTVMVEEGKPIDVILRAAKALGCDLIVTGIARDETLGRFGLGTTVDLLLRRSKVPGLIVKQRVRSPYKHIVVATRPFGIPGACASSRSTIFSGSEAQHLSCV
jgi:nucleotide-binding universal stress UspA family protein